MSKTKIVIHELGKESDNIITMGDMQPGQVGVIVGETLYNKKGMYVLRTTSVDEFQVLNLSTFKPDRCWCDDDDVSVPVRIIDALIEVHELDMSGNSVKKKVQNHAPVCTCNTMSDDPAEHAFKCAVRLDADVVFIQQTNENLCNKLLDVTTEKDVAKSQLRNQVEVNSNLHSRLVDARAAVTVCSSKENHKLRAKLRDQTDMLNHAKALFNGELEKFTLGDGLPKTPIHGE